MSRHFPVDTKELMTVRHSLMLSYSTLSLLPLCRPTTFPPTEVTHGEVKIQSHKVESAERSTPRPPSFFLTLLPEHYNTHVRPLFLAINISPSHSNDVCRSPLSFRRLVTGQTASSAELQLNTPIFSYTHCSNIYTKLAADTFLPLYVSREPVERDTAPSSVFVYHRIPYHSTPPPLQPAPSYISSASPRKLYISAQLKALHPSIAQLQLNSSQFSPHLAALHTNPGLYTPTTVQIHQPDRCTAEQ